MKRMLLVVLAVILGSGMSFAEDRAVVVKPKPKAIAGKELKTALVIGNSTYIFSPLKNPANDAKTIAKALRELGFSVDERTNLSQIEMKQAVEAFGKK